MNRDVQPRPAAQPSAALSRAPGGLFVLPTFLFILLGAPFIEGTQGQLKFTAPLTGITAAVVGVIVHLAVFFAHHVLWPQGFSGRFDWGALGIGLAAALALFRFKLGVVPVIAASAVAGLATHLANF